MKRVVALLYILCSTIAVSDSDGLLFDVKYHHAEVPMNIASALASGTDENAEFEIFRVASQFGNPKEYICSVLLNDAGIQNTKHKSMHSAFEDLSQNLKQKAIDEIQKSFPKHDCVFAFDLNGRYWTYAYCFGDKVIQYHESEPAGSRAKKHTPTFPEYVYVLGRQLDASSKKVTIANQAVTKDFVLHENEFEITDGQGDPFTTSIQAQGPSITQKMLKHTLSNGEICDLTKAPRMVDVVYKCDPVRNRGRVEIVMVEEVQTCHYQMIVSVPQLCAVEGFTPTNEEMETVQQIDCKFIASKSEGASPGEVANFTMFKEKVPNMKLKFPVPRDYKITLSEYLLMPFGDGFYLGLSKESRTTDHLYFNHRHILVYNRDFETPQHFIQSIGKMFSKILEQFLLAPFTEEDNTQRPISWNDTFTLWFEIYDYKGDFYTLSRVARNGRRNKKVLEIQLVDPDTMLDQDGEAVQDIRFGSLEYQAPNDAWNFQLFDSPDFVQKGIQVEDTFEDEEYETETQTEFITVTVIQSEAAVTTETSEVDAKELEEMKEMVRLLQEMIEEKQKSENSKKERSGLHDEL